LGTVTPHIFSYESIGIREKTMKESEIALLDASASKKSSVLKYNRVVSKELKCETISVGSAMPLPKCCGSKVRSRKREGNDCTWHRPEQSPVK
jgi:hypothetical protein